MNAKLILFGLLLSGIVILYSLNICQAITGPHGGELKPAENFNIELKEAFPNLHCYLLDQKLLPVSNKGVLCEVRFFLPNETSVDLNLKPFEDDGFILESNTIVYNSCRVTFNMSGKSVSAKFSKENLIVNDK
ncbi:MAG: hypothetical protein V4547_07420 [Bacteroidota bacterium]